MRAWVAMLAVVCGCSREAPPPAAVDPALVDGAKALEEVRALVELGPREPGTEGAARAAAHLAARLQALGIRAETDVFTNRTPRGDVVFRNVLGSLPGTGEETIAVVSHYDTKSGIDPAFAGANDSGSSSGLLLELARVWAAQLRGGPRLLLAFVDGEECMRAYGPDDGLHGSRRLAGRLAAEGSRRLRGVIVLDMIGDRDLAVTIPRNGTPALIRAVFEAAEADGSRARFSLADGEVLDDHVPFLERGMPAVDLIDFAYGSAPGLNDYWHTAADTMDKLSAESLAVVGRVVVRAVNGLSNPPPAGGAR